MSSPEGHSGSFGTGDGVLPNVLGVPSASIAIPRVTPSDTDADSPFIVGRSAPLGTTPSTGPEHAQTHSDVEGKDINLARPSSAALVSAARGLKPLPTMAEEGASPAQEVSTQRAWLNIKKSDKHHVRVHSAASYDDSVVKAHQTKKPKSATIEAAQKDVVWLHKQTKWLKKMVKELGSVEDTKERRKKFRDVCATIINDQAWKLLGQIADLVHTDESDEHKRAVETLMHDAEAELKRLHDSMTQYATKETTFIVQLRSLLIVSQMDPSMEPPTLEGGEVVTEALVRERDADTTSLSGLIKDVTGAQKALSDLVTRAEIALAKVSGTATLPVERTSNKERRKSEDRQHHTSSIGVRVGTDGHYRGAMHEGQRQGQGTFTFTSGDTYEGQWMANRREGFGKYTIRDEKHYQGMFKNDLPSGKGVIQYEDGHKYVGDVTVPSGSNNLLKNYDVIQEGHGEICYANGDRYCGGWQNNLRHGYGVQFYVSGEAYYGSWQKGKRIGFALFVYPDGTCHCGDWKDDHKDGRGTLYFSTGDTMAGTWRFDNVSKGVYTKGHLGHAATAAVDMLRALLKKDYNDDSRVPVAYGDADAKWSGLFESVQSQIAHLGVVATTAGHSRRGGVTLMTYEEAAVAAGSSPSLGSSPLPSPSDAISPVRGRGRSSFSTDMHDPAEHIRNLAKALKSNTHVLGSLVRQFADTFALLYAGRKMPKQNMLAAAIDDIHSFKGRLYEATLEAYPMLKGQAADCRSVVDETIFPKIYTPLSGLVLTHNKDADSELSIKVSSLKNVTLADLGADPKFWLSALEKRDGAAKAPTICSHDESSPAEVYCSACQAAYCTACSEVLHRAPKLRTHAVTPIQAAFAMSEKPSSPTTGLRLATASPAATMQEVPPWPGAADGTAMEANIEAAVASGMGAALGSPPVVRHSDAELYHIEAAVATIRQENEAMREELGLSKSTSMPTAIPPKSRYRQPSVDQGLSSSPPPGGPRFRSGSPNMSQLIKPAAKPAPAPPAFTSPDSQQPYHMAITTLRKISAAESPSAKLACLLGTSSTLCAAVEHHYMGTNSNILMGAEDKFPVFIYVVVKAAVPCLASEILFMKQFLSSDDAESEAGYRLSELEAATEYINALNWNVRDERGVLMPLSSLKTKLRDAYLNAMSEVRAASASQVPRLAWLVELLYSISTRRLGDYSPITLSGESKVLATQYFGVSQPLAVAMGLRFYVVGRERELEAPVASPPEPVKTGSAWGAIRKTIKEEGVVGLFAGPLEAAVPDPALTHHKSGVDMHRLTSDVGALMAATTLDDEGDEVDAAPPVPILDDALLGKSLVVEPPSEIATDGAVTMLGLAMALGPLTSMVPAREQLWSSQPTASVAESTARPIPAGQAPPTPAGSSPGIVNPVLALHDDSTPPTRSAAPAARLAESSDAATPEVRERNMGSIGESADELATPTKPAAPQQPLKLHLPAGAQSLGATGRSASLGSFFAELNAPPTAASPSKPAAAAPAPASAGPSTPALSAVKARPSIRVETRVRALSNAVRPVGTPRVFTTVVTPGVAVPDAQVSGCDPALIAATMRFELCMPLDVYGTLARTLDLELSKAT